jgi:hypothetical protein
VASARSTSGASRAAMDTPWPMMGVVPAGYVADEDHAVIDDSVAPGAGHGVAGAGTARTGGGLAAVAGTRPTARSARSGDNFALSLVYHR